MAPSSRASYSPVTPWRIFAVVLAIVFVAELGVMAVLPVLLPPRLDGRLVALVDATLLTIAAAPILWWVIILPLRRVAITQQARATSVIDAAVEGIMTIDARGVVSSFNPAAERIFGYEADEIIGRDVSLLVPDEFITRHREALERYRQTGRSSVVGRTVEVPGRRRDGSEVSLELSVSELHFGGRRLFTGIVRDLTESKARARQQAAMVEFGQRALACTDLEELLQEAAQCVAQTLDVEHGYVLWNCPRAATRWCSEGARAGTRGRLDGKSSTPVKTTQWAECLPRKR